MKKILGLMAALSLGFSSMALQAQDASKTDDKELRNLQRDMIDLQKQLMQSGVTPELKEDLQKIKKIDDFQGALDELKAANEELVKSGKALEEQVKGLQESKAEAKPEEAKPEVETFASRIDEAQVGANMVWVLVTAFLVFLMQAGFALVETGLTRAKNAAHTMIMNLMDYCIGMLAYWAFGFAIMFGNQQSLSSLGFEGGLDKGFSINIGGEDYGLFGTAGWFLSGPNMLQGGIFTLFMFQLVFSNTTNTIPTGTLAERWRFGGFVMHSIILSGFLYPLFGNWVWGGGWLAKLGYSDFAGSSVVHMAGGMMALTGAYVVGPRAGKFNPDGTPNPIPGHNLPMAVLGTFLLAFGWFGFNPGSTLSAMDPQIGIIAVNTALASGAGACAAMAASALRFGKPDASFMCNGMLGGLVGITAPCAYVSTWAAVVIGAVCGVAVVYSVLFVEEKLKLDDPVGAISVHGTCGALGCLALGLLANGTYADKTGLFYGDGHQFLIQVLGVVVCFFFFGISGYLMFMFTDRVVGNVASEAEQKEGLDIGEMGIEAYGEDPDAR